MVAVRVTEMYDLSTQVGKVGMVAIHTPPFATAKKLWQGLFNNYKFVRLASCDVALACAQTLPADPLQVGTEAGDIAPQDMFNPILYKAVSNDSFNTVLSRIYGLTAVPSTATGTNLGSISEGDWPGYTDADAFSFYYGLLADKDGWRKAMPQAGLTMKGLYPIVYSVVNNFGNMSPLGGGSIGDSDVPIIADNGASTSGGSVTFRGPSMRMPRLPTKVRQGSSPVDLDAPRTYVACIVLPPAKLHKFYYRMRVTWTLEFEELRPISDVDSSFAILQLGKASYGTDYVEQSSKMDVKTDAVDGNGVAIEKIMTAGR